MNVAPGKPVGSYVTQSIGQGLTTLLLKHFKIAAPHHPLVHLLVRRQLYVP